MSFYDQISSNKRRSLLLIVLFFGFVVFLGFIVGFFYGSSGFGIGLALFIGVLYFLFSYFSGSKAILGMMKAKKATKPQHTYLINTVEGLCLAAGLKHVPEIYVIEDTALNAFATGRDPEHSAVVFTSGLLAKLDRSELEGVIAHELAHIKNYDIRVMMLASVLVGLTVFLSDFLLRSFLWGGARRNNKEGGSMTVVFVLVGLALAILAPLVGEMIKLAISRKREFLADASAAQFTRHPQGLANALRKIKGDPDPLVDSANRATAHLFISSPFRRRKMTFKNLWSTHPDIDERIKRLESM